MNAKKKFHFASHDHSKYDYPQGIIISETRNPKNRDPKKLTRNYLEKN